MKFERKKYLFALTNVSPMNGIIGMTELALETLLTDEQREYLKLVHSSALGLLTIINDLLDFSKIEAGKLDLEQIELPLRFFCQLNLLTMSEKLCKTQ